MKISDLLQESQQLDELKASDIGRGVGKVAKGVGAVAGGVAGIPGAVKKGFQAGKTAVAGDNTQAADAQTPPADNTQAADPNAQQPAEKKPGLLQKIGQAAGDFKKGFQQGSGTPAAEPEQAAQDDTELAAIKQELSSFLQTYKPKVDAIEKQVANLVNAQSADTAAAAEPEIAQDEKPGFMKSATDLIKDRAKKTQTQSIHRTGHAVNESIQLFRKS